MVHQLVAHSACLLLLALPAAQAQNVPRDGIAAAASIDQDTHAESSLGVTIFKVQMDVRVVAAQAYGTLEFQGHVERIDLGDSYEFRPRIDITFRPGEVRNGYIVTNRTPVADLRWCVLVATQFRKGDKQHQVLYRERLPIAIRLSKDGETKPLPDLSFRLDKSVSDRASHVGLGVSDGRLLWPIPTRLK